MTNKRLFKRIGIDGVGAILVVFLAIVLFRIWNPGGDVWTNDAYVNADYTTIAPQVSGLISQVLVNDNEHVDAGQVLPTIDDRDYVVAGRCSPWSPSRKSISMPITLRLTGNFTKVVQRLAGKIVFNPGQKLVDRLRVGMTVETTIHTGNDTITSNGDPSLPSGAIQ